jgi:hypothetical protein
MATKPAARKAPTKSIVTIFAERGINEKQATTYPRRWSQRGFIGGHLVKRLKASGSVEWSVKRHEYCESAADEFIVGDLCDQDVAQASVEGIDEVYQLAADVGRANYIFIGEHDAAVPYNSGRNQPEHRRVRSSSACMYPQYNQFDPDNPKYSEDSAYPAAPDSEYGWEKLFWRAPLSRLYAELWRRGAGCMPGSRRRWRTPANPLETLR